LGTTELGELLTVAQIADEMQVTAETVRRWIQTERLRGTLINRRAGYRVRRSDYEQFLQLERAVAPRVSAPADDEPALGLAERVTAR